MSVPRPDGPGACRNWLFVEVETDAGLTGLGEATTEYHELAVKAQIEAELRPRLLGMNPAEIERIWQMGYREFWWRRGVVHTSAFSGVDMALWDIAGKAAGLPVFQLLGGKVRETVRLYIRYGPEFYGVDRDTAAHRCRAMGFDAFKHGWGTPTRPYDGDRQVEVSIAENARFRELLGPEVALMVDAAGMFSPQQAHRLLEQLRPLRPLFVEEPTAQDTVEPTLRLKRSFPDVLLALGERMMTRWDFRPWFEPQAIDVCQADICHTGGISELVKIAHFAEIYGIQMAPHNPYGPVALAACAHACAAMQNFLILEYCPIQPWFDQVQALKVPVHQGRVDMNELGRRPGLGVELDREIVASRAGCIRLAWNRATTADGSTPLL